MTYDHTTRYNEGTETTTRYNEGTVDQLVQTKLMKYTIGRLAESYEEVERLTRRCNNLMRRVSNG